VPSVRITPLTLEKSISLPELHLPSCGMIFPYVRSKYSTLGTRNCYSRLLCSLLHQNTQTHTLAGKSLKVTRIIHFMSSKKLIHFVPRSTQACPGCTQWLLSISYSLKLLSSVQWMSAFRKTRNCGIPWSTWEGHSFLQRFSGDKRIHLFFTGLNTYSQIDSRLFLKMTSGI
jgi:hypothetical protein